MEIVGKYLENVSLFVRIILHPKPRYATEIPRLASFRPHNRRRSGFGLELSSFGIISVANDVLLSKR